MGWKGMRAKALGSLLMIEVREMLTDGSGIEVVGSWREEFKAGSQSELVEVRKLMEKKCKGWRVEVKCKKRRWILTKLRGGTARSEV